MINPLSKLTVLHDNNGTFSDHTEAAADYIRDTFSIDLSSTEDYLYIGFFKPFGSTFVALSTANVNVNTLNAQYWNGTSWTSLVLTDESKGLTRDGFLLWDKTNMKSTTVNSKEAFYIRLRPSADHSATVVRGINIVFSDDNALKAEFFDIDNPQLLRAGETSHLVQHVAARNTIIQQLRNQNYKKRTAGTTNPLEEITEWDLMDIFQVREASIMLTLSKIFFMLSDSPEDIWWAKYSEYQKRYQQAMNLATLSIDSDNDGEEDANENAEQYENARWTR